jgi:hypothetical protein
MHTSRRGRRVAPATPVRPGRPNPGFGRKPRTASSLRKGRGQRSRMRRTPSGGRDRLPRVQAAVRHRLRWPHDRDPAQRCISARRQDLAVFRRAPLLRPPQCRPTRTPPRDLPPLRSLRHPWGASRDFCHPGVRFLPSLVEWRHLARDCVRSFSEGSGCARILVDPWRSQRTGLWPQT